MRDSEKGNMEIEEHYLIHKKGITLSGIPFWLGLILMIVSIYFLIHTISVVTQTIAILGVIFGLVLLLAIMETRFDFLHKKASIRLHMLVFKVVIKSIDLSEFDSIELRLFIENQTMNLSSITNTIKTRVYELYVHKGGLEKCLIAESTDYAESLQLMHKLSEKLNLKAEDKFKLLKQKLRARRKV